jgi:hypothetical protein
MTATTPASTQAPQSTYVTVVAWVFIVLSGNATLIGALQNVRIWSVPLDQFDFALRDSTFANLIPGPERFMLSHIHAYFLAAFLLSLTMFISSLGLLGRRNWARLVFITLLVLGVLYLVAGLLLQQSVMASLAQTFSGVEPSGSVSQANLDRFRSMFAVLRIFMYVLYLGIAVLFARIAFRLSSPTIRAEFASGAA